MPGVAEEPGPAWQEQTHSSGGECEIIHQDLLMVLGQLSTLVTSLQQSVELFPRVWVIGQCPLSGPLVISMCLGLGGPLRLLPSRILVKLSQFPQSPSAKGVSETCYKEALVCPGSLLGYHLRTATKKNIWHNEYIDLLSLLPLVKDFSKSGRRTS